MEITPSKAARWAVWIATSGGVGFCPLAPGTAGSLVGIAVLVVLLFLPVSKPISFGLLMVLLATIVGVGVWAAGRAEEFFQRKDPGPVVIDEVAGQLVTFLAWPQTSWEWLVGGFLTFRFFDIVKPFPARRLEHLPGGWGVMLDDVVAGAYSLGLLYLLHLVLR